jgi:hypothetical protein
MKTVTVRGWLSAPLAWFVSVETLTVFHVDDGLDRTRCAFDALAEIDIVKHHRDVERISDLLFLTGFLAARHLLSPASPVSAYQLVVSSRSDALAVIDLTLVRQSDTCRVAASIRLIPVSH